MDPFKDITLNALQIIQLMVAPAVMISACGLLLLGMHNRYSLVVGRIRLLNEEKRHLMNKVGESQASTDVNVRLESIATQLDALVLRARLVRNAVLSYTSAVASYVVTSLLLGISSLLAFGKLNFIILFAFLMGMILVLLGIYFAGWEIKKGYDIISYEVKAHD